jgi:asparagine synthase (glutamine-hydrolysing)
MSGIMAIVSMNGRPIPGELIRNQLAAITHRGEGEARSWLGRGVALGHVNLATTNEAEREYLPISDGTERYWITWDGRLDNRAELAHDLGLPSIDAAERTDADYVLLAYRRWGKDIVERLLGDWALVVWDTQSRELFCAKDPVGWRQLFFAEHDGLLLIGSEPQQLFAGGHLPRSVNRDFVLRSLVDAVQEPGDTYFAGMRELTGGQSLVVRDGKATVATYWAEPRISRRPYKRPQEYVEEFVWLFRDATRLRLRTNRRIGIYLSGGLDSSYIAAVSAQSNLKPLTLTAYAPDTEWMDERRYARIVTGHLDFPCNEIDISDCWSLSHRWLPDKLFDEPEIPPQGATHVRLAMAAREAGLGVMLGGEGADEWMTGNGTHLADALCRGRLSSAWHMTRRSRSTGKRLMALATDTYRYAVPRRLQSRVRRLRRRHSARDLWHVADPNPAWVSTGGLAEPTIYEQSVSRRAEWLLYRQSAGRTVSWRERNALTPNHVELRTPFNDLRIIELMASTPEWMKRFNGRRKDLLREAEYRVLPREIPDREDFGLYTELVNLGVGDRERRRVEDGIESVIKLEGVRPTAAREEVNRWVEWGHNWWEPNWRLICTGLWLNQLTPSG